MAIPQRRTAQIVEAQVAQQRRGEQLRTEYSAFSADGRRLAERAEALERADLRRKDEQRMREEGQRAMLDREASIRTQKAEREFEIASNTAWRDELERRKLEESRKEAEIMRICQESPELRALQAQLSVAYVSKEREAQIIEKEMLKKREREREQAIEDYMEVDRRRALKEEQEKSLARKYLSLQQRELLQQQIIDRRSRQEDSSTQAQLDKEMVDFIVEQINQQDMRAEEEKRKRQVDTRRIAKEQEEEKRRRVEHERMMEKAEELRIREHYEQVQKREEEAERLRAEQRKEAERIFTQIVRETQRKQADDEEFRQMRDLLWEEEAMAKQLQEEQRRRDRQQQIRADMIKSNAESSRLREEVRRQKAEEEARLVARMMEKFRLDEMQEREAEARRIESKKVYMQQIAQQRDERRNLYDQEKSAEQAEARRMQEAEEFKQAVIKEARKRLLQEHAAKLRGYLPPGTIVTEEELQMLR